MATTGIGRTVHLDKAGQDALKALFKKRRRIMKANKGHLQTGWPYHTSHAGRTVRIRQRTSAQWVVNSSCVR